MDIEDLRAELQGLFNPEPEENGGSAIKDIPHPRLERQHRLDLSYLGTCPFEGFPISAYIRRYRSKEFRIAPLFHNWDVPSRLFEAALQLFGDSVLARHGQTKRKGDLRYYPAVILTFWSGFETFVRHASELMLVTVKDVPPVVSDFLRDKETFVERPTGKIKTRTRHQSVLDRYRLLLRYGYGYDVPRGVRHWQKLEQARELRDYYTHLDVNNPRAISSEEVVDFMEAVLIGVIWPSAEVKRTQLVGIYRLYWTWDTLRKLAALEPFVEQPFFKDWPIDGSGSRIVYCPFEGVDSKRFPKLRKGRTRHSRRR